ncbi:MAG: hypothetical protein RhofKO_10390 [Rhodothermales bacterium]
MPALVWAQSGPSVQVVPWYAEARNEAASLHVAELLEAALLERGAEPAANATWQFYVSATVAGEQVAFTVVQLARLSEAKVEAGAQAELLYADADPVTLAPGGTRMRQQVSKGFLRQLGTIEQITTEVIAVDEVDDAVSSLVFTFFENHTR